MLEDLYSLLPFGQGQIYFINHPNKINSRKFPDQNLLPFLGNPKTVHAVSCSAKTPGHRGVHITNYFSKKDTNSQVFGIQGKSCFRQLPSPKQT